MSRSTQQAPDNPGPLNSHGLVLRALQQMQALSLAYLTRFLAQAEAWAWLDQASNAVPAVPAPARLKKRSPAKSARPPTPPPARVKQR